MIRLLGRLARRFGVYQQLYFVRSFLSVRLRFLRNAKSSFYISKGSVVSGDFKTGEFGYMGPNCIICPKVSVGDYVMFGPQVIITGSDHNYDVVGVPMIFSGRPELKETNIGSDVWIGARAVIMAGVTIGDGVIVAANAVLTSDAQSFSIYAGVPAKLIKSRFSNEIDVEFHKNVISQAGYLGDYCDTMR